MNYGSSILGIILAVCLAVSCSPPPPSSQTTQASLSEARLDSPYLIVLGNVQDGGSPHIGCQKTCCQALFKQADPHRMVVCLGLVDPQNHASYLFEATPDLTRQVQQLGVQLDQAPAPYSLPKGIFLTHAHIGHYSGLMYLGKEALGGKNIPVYAMPRMQAFLRENGPWSQLINLNNIELRPLEADQPISLSPYLSTTPFRVPHRDEFSETVGYLIQGSQRSALFIPDIDKWEKWDQDLVQWLSRVDYAFLDATFYDAEEVNHRDIRSIPHPFVIETMEKLAKLSAEEKKKVYFILMNHTNPLLDPASAASQEVLNQGYKVARFGDRFHL